ncbi:MAG: hypothetical protein JO333_06485, partial [Verrucomicrobia bacterium]|nr:hypothetical protein [Verrucomicrobiota bacterium]
MKNICFRLLPGTFCRYLTINYRRKVRLMAILLAGLFSSLPSFAQISGTHTTPVVVSTPATIDPGTMITVTSGTTPALQAITGGQIVTAPGTGVITITSSTSIGVQAFRDGSITLNNSSITTTGSGGWGLNANQGVGTTITVTNSEIITTGADNARAVRADAGAGGGITNDDISIKLVDDKITTIGTNSAGIDADGRAVADPTTVTITAMDTEIITTGATTPSLEAANAFSVAAAANEKKTVRAQNGAQVTLSGGSATTMGAGAPGVWIDAGGLVKAQNYTVMAEGEGSPALQLVDRRSASGATTERPPTQNASFTNSKLTSMQGPAISIPSGTAIVSLTGSSVSGNGVLLDVATSPFATAPSAINLTANSSTLTGDVQTAAGTSANIILENGTTLTGNILADPASTVNVSIDPSTWIMTDDSDVTGDFTLDGNLVVNSVAKFASTGQASVLTIGGNLTIGS